MEIYEATPCLKIASISFLLCCEHENFSPSILHRHKLQPTESYVPYIQVSELLLLSFDNHLIKSSQLLSALRMLPLSLSKNPIFWEKEHLKNK